MKKIIFLIAILFFFGCKIPKEETTAYVFKTEDVHLGVDMHKLRVYYEFEYNGNLIRNDFKYPKIDLIYAREYLKVGDSVIVEFPINKPQKSKVIRMKTQSDN